MNYISEQKVVIVLLNYNGLSDTVECLRSLSKPNYTNLETIVVDNASTDGSVEYIKSRYPKIIVISNKKNLGYSMGFNIGMKHALSLGANFVLILNNDTFIHPDAVNSLISVTKKNNNVGVVFGKVYFYNTNRIQSVGKLSDQYLLRGKLVGYGELDEGKYEVTKEYDFVDDVCLLVTRQAIEATGGYDSDLFLYFEEVDWFIRLRQKGFRILYLPEAKIWHKVSQSTGGKWNKTKSYHLSRSRVICLRKNLEDTKMIIALTLFLSKNFPKRILYFIITGDFFLAKAYISGFFSGIKWVVKTENHRSSMINNNIFAVEN